MPREAKISEELATFLESGLSIVVATRDGALEPSGANGWAAAVSADGTRLTVHLYEDAARAMLANLEAHPEIAIDFDLPTSHRACQVKGRFLDARASRADERAGIDRQVAAFGRDLGAIGVPASMLAGWVTWPCRAIDLHVTQVFEQTPGPGTGEPLK